MAQTGDGFLWAQLGGYGGDSDSWLLSAPGNPRDAFLAAYYKGYSEGSNSYPRPPAGQGYALWLVMAARFVAHLNAIYGTLCSDVGWPPELQWIELWNEAIPSGVGGKNVVGSPYDFDQGMIPMLDWFARNVNRDFDGRGKRKMLCSTVVASYGGANYSLQGKMPIPEDRTFGEISQTLRAIQEWVDETKEYNWHGLFDGISLNPYAPIGDMPPSGAGWGFTGQVSRSQVIMAAEAKLNAIINAIRGHTGSWMQHLPLYINEFGSQPAWLSMRENQGFPYGIYPAGVEFPENVELTGQLRYEGVRYMAERLGEDRVCAFTLSADSDYTDTRGYALAQRFVGSGYPPTFQSARAFLNAAGWDASGPTDPNGQPWSPS